MQQLRVFSNFSLLAIILMAIGGCFAEKLKENWQKSGQSIFDYCEGLYYTSETPQKTLCQILKLEANDNTPSGDSYINCNFRLLNYVNDEGLIDGDKIIQDFHAAQITDKDSEVNQIIQDCEQELPSKKAIDYYTCFLINNNVKSSFSKVFKARGVRPQNSDSNYDSETAVLQYDLKANDCSSDV
ncbi:uncharacterized protein LOC129753823 [Uranotaenia lowii]|uniref:uncharacterized protein LOC129753823 n=1 Tax=Uranotaenia lowii TaxID=190385 RepID=UPI00247A86B2|nr:uncharacterized protein LOC129753823 [Uranotaenia lowii]